MNSSVATICRPGASLEMHRAEGRQAIRALWRTLAVLVIGSAIYGFSFGIWRDIRQALYSAAKMPVLFLGVTIFSAAGNLIIAQVLGVVMTWRQTFQAIFGSVAVTTTLLAALAPVFVFFAFAWPAPTAGGSRDIYFALLTLHTAAVGGAGLIGMLRLWQLIRGIAGTLRRATLTMICWLGLSGLAGSEISWICSPFLSRPEKDVHLLNENAFRMNMYEYLWRIARGVPIE